MVSVRVAYSYPSRLVTVHCKLPSSRIASALRPAHGPVDPLLVGQAVLKSGLLIVVVVLYGRARWPAYLVAAVWPVGFLYALRVGHAPGPVLLVGLLIGAAWPALAAYCPPVHLRSADRAHRIAPVSGLAAKLIGGSPDTRIDCPPVARRLQGVNSSLTCTSQPTRPEAT